MDSSKQQATFGKRAAGVIVTDLDGNRISFDHALIRSALRVVSVFAYLFAAFTRRQQALHHLVADTLVLPGTL